MLRKVVKISINQAVKKKQNTTAVPIRTQQQRLMTKYFNPTCVTVTRQSDERQKHYSKIKFEIFFSRVWLGLKSIIFRSVKSLLTFKATTNVVRNTTQCRTHDHLGRRFLCQHSIWEIMLQLMNSTYILICWKLFRRAPSALTIEDMVGYSVNADILGLNVAIYVFCYGYRRRVTFSAVNTGLSNNVACDWTEHRLQLNVRADWLDETDLSHYVTQHPLSFWYGMNFDFKDV